MFSFPYFRNHGYLLYLDMVHVYPPLLTLILGFLYKVFGYHLWVLQLSTWTMLLVNDLLIFAIAKKFSKSERGAFLSVLLYIAVQPFLEGNQLWFDIALTTPLLIGFLMVLHKRFVLAGLFFAAAGFIKQTGGLFFLIYLLWFFITHKNIKTTVKIFATSLIFAIPLAIRLIQEGALQGFFNWVIIYPSLYWTKFPGYVDMMLDRREVVILLIIILPAVALLQKKKAWLLFLFCVAGTMSVYPRFSFFHFQTALPFFALAYSLISRINKKQLAIAAVVFLVVAEQYIYKPVLAFEWQKPARFWSDRGDLPIESVTQGEKIYLLGYHSLHYVFSKTLPPKPWIDSYPWVFEVPNLQSKTIEAWSNSPPTFIFWQAPKEGNWYDIGTYQPKEVTGWIKQMYVEQGQNIWKIRN